MVHIDDDEFIALSSFGNFSAAQSLSSPANHLFEYSKRLFDGSPQASAIRISPVIVPDCTSSLRRSASTPLRASSSFTSSTNSGPPLQSSLYAHILPRLYKHYDGLPFFSHEGKMIMRTDAVRMFFVHYLTLIERGGPWKKKKQLIEPKMTDAALLHFKVPAGVSGVIWGTQLPIQRVAVAEECARNYDANMLQDYAQVSSNVLETLALKVKQKQKSLK
jgi:hypothetical protein